MSFPRPLRVAFALLAFPVVGPAADLTPLEAEQIFVRRIKPLFQEKCLACHGRDEEKIKGGLDLRTLASTLEGGDSLAPALVAGKPGESPLYRSVTRDDPDFEAMPPKENDALSAAQVDEIKAWILAGAPWPDEARTKELLSREDKWSATEGITVVTSGGLDADWTNRRYKPEDLWAYRPLRKPAVPAARDGEIERQRDSEQKSSASPSLSVSPSPLLHPNPIDAFVEQRLPAGLTPAPAADARTFIRRATFDLLGLPPTPEEVAAFESAHARDPQAAVRALIDRLLASPHYGEKWGQHWLDVVRYADTSGFANDYARGNAWRYRDYVVRAFNTDKPYDRFVREQIAGDELAEARNPALRPPPASAAPVAGATAGKGKKRAAPAKSATAAAGTAAATPAAPAAAEDDPPPAFAPSVARGETVPAGADAELLLATGFLRMGPWELTGMEVPKIARQKLLDDVTDSVGQTFLAHPLQCARCHDHKFDPVPTRDYYAFQAVFATMQLAERPAAFLPEENVSGFDEVKYLRQRETFYRAELKRLDEKSLAAARGWYREKKLDPAAFEAAVADIVGRPGTRGRDNGFSAVRSALMRQGIPEDNIPPKGVGFSPEDYGHERIARKGLERIRWELDRYEPIAFAVYSGRTPELRSVNAPLRLPANRLSAGELEQTCILTGGDPFATGAPVQPAILSAAASLGVMPPDLARVPDTIAGRRLALAEWIASPQNPLTARVMANRIWLWHFGQPLAGNPNNFGVNGKKPTHPELLDWLAATFIEQGWSVKAMHRLVMTSAAYARSSAHPEPARLAEKDPLGLSYAAFKPRRLGAEEMRDAMLALSGELNRTVGGIPARPEINRETALQPRQVMGTFAEAWQPNPLPEQRHRRSLYALKIRGQLDPFMEVFNAPSPDLSCEARDASTVTPQVFALFNSEASHDRALALAARIQKETTSPAAALDRLFRLVYARPPAPAELALARDHWQAMTVRHAGLTFARPEIPRSVIRDAVEENTGEKFSFTEPLEIAADFVPDLKPVDAPAETRALADLCLVLLNSNEFVYVY